jgi:hypothetical protein
LLGAGAGPDDGGCAGGGVPVPSVPLGGGVLPSGAGAPPDGDGWPPLGLAPVVWSGGDDDVSLAPMAGPGAAGPEA